MVIPIICENDLQIVFDKIQEQIEKGSIIIKGIKLVDYTDKQIVILVSDNPISPELASIWWEGYTIGLRSALEE